MGFMQKPTVLLAAMLLTGAVLSGSAYAQDRTATDGASDGTSRKNTAPRKNDKPGSTDNVRDTREAPPAGTGNSSDTTGPGRSGDPNGNRGRTGGSGGTGSGGTGSGGTGSGGTGKRGPGGANPGPGSGSPGHPR